MLAIKLSKHYEDKSKKFVKKNLQRVKQIKKALKLLVKNPAHPSLNAEKLIGTDVWTIRIDRANRIFFTWEDKNTLLFIDIGKHDKYRKY